jgi:hypothetical protein
VAIGQVCQAFGRSMNTPRPTPRSRARPLPPNQGSARSALNYLCFPPPLPLGLAGDSIAPQVFAKLEEMLPQAMEQQENSTLSVIPTGAHAASFASPHGSGAAGTRAWRT